eukprot:scaffold43251_cov58-Phaeocystis_antarctica.AAC.3
MSDGSLPQPTQARLSATFGGATPSSAAGGTPSLAAGWVAAAFGSLALLRLQRCQRLADLPGGRSQVWLLLPQLGEQRLEAEVGIGHSQCAHGREKGLRHSPCHRRERV